VIRDWSHMDVIGMKLRGQWPPALRCENCEHWKRPWFYRIFAPKGLGRCDVVRDSTWRSYTCASHYLLQWVRNSSSTGAKDA
jgi:hypothetical protein